MRSRTALLALLAVIVAPTIGSLLYFGFANSDGSDRSFATEPDTGRFVDLVTAVSSSATPSVPFCSRAAFVFADDAPKAGQAFHDGDVLRVPIRFAAPGCKRVSGIIFGYFPPHTPWWDYYCPACGESRHFDGSIPIEDMLLPGAGGIAYIIALPGQFPPTDLASPPNLEGFVFCGAVLAFHGTTTEELDPHEQLDAGCGCPSSASSEPVQFTTPAGSQ
jgi:hypothetical protein